MSSPVFSSNPDDYPDVVDVMIGLDLTPVLIVIGGSYATNTTHEKSDLDIWGYYLEDTPDEVSIDAPTRLSVLGDSDWTQMIFFSLNSARLEPVNDPPRRIWHRENFLAYPRIYDSTHAEDFRKELLEVPVKTVAEQYLEAGDWHVHVPSNTTKMKQRAIRLFLTGARLLAVGDLVIDYQVLTDWAKISAVTKARRLLQRELKGLRGSPPRAQ